MNPAATHAADRDSLQFRLRGGEVTRLEAFSDAAFAFAVTLLVVSLEVPRSFDQLLDAMRGLPAFAVCFAVLLMFWSAHHNYFRRYGLADRATFLLNAVFLFVVLAYVYPLKFLFVLFLGMLTGIAPGAGGSGGLRIAPGQADDLFVIYGVGFTAACTVLGLMYSHAWRRREALALSEYERIMTCREMASAFGKAAVGLLSTTIALFAPLGWIGWAGWIYALIGAVEFACAYYYAGIRVSRLEQRLGAKAS